MIHFCFHFCCQVARKDTDVESVFMWGTHAHFYESFLHDYFIKNVIDMTPGSGDFAFVCIEQRVGCICICMSEGHAAGIRAYLMGKIVEGMGKEGSKVYQPKFAKLLNGTTEAEGPKAKAKAKGAAPKAASKKKPKAPANDATDGNPAKKPRRPKPAAPTAGAAAGEQEELSDFAFSELEEEEEEDDEDGGRGEDGE